MNYFLITAEVPVTNGKSVITVACEVKNVFFGKDEMDKNLLALFDKKSKGYTANGSPNITFIYKLTKKEYEYYSTH